MTAREMLRRAAGSLDGAADILGIDAAHIERLAVKKLANIELGHPDRTRQLAELFRLDAAALRQLADRLDAEIAPLLETRANPLGDRMLTTGGHYALDVLLRLDVPLTPPGDSK